jgi:hypothetical protein
MQDCVIGCFWDDVRIWARSLGDSGFGGRKVALVRAPKSGVVQKLTGDGFEVVDFSGSPPAGTPPVDRFTQLRRYLRHSRQLGVQFRWVVATDVRDVCFQCDPVAYLERLGPPRLVLSVEGLGFAHEEWNAANMAASFGMEALELALDTAPCNAGVLAGGARAIEGLALLVEQLARAASHDYPDQAALNLLLAGLGGALWLHRIGSAEPWACQAGVMAAPYRIARNRPHLLGPEPVFRDGRVLTAGGELYAIVHQYDRVAEWADAIQARFRA